MKLRSLKYRGGGFSAAAQKTLPLASLINSIGIIAGPSNATLVSQVGFKHVRQNVALGASTWATFCQATGAKLLLISYTQSDLAALTAGAPVLAPYVEALEPINEPAGFDNNTNYQYGIFQSGGWTTSGRVTAPADGTYHVGDVVNVSGQNMTCKQAHTPTVGNQPTTSTETAIWVKTCWYDARMMTNQLSAIIAASYPKALLVASGIYNYLSDEQFSSQDAALTYGGLVSLNASRANYHDYHNEGPASNQQSAATTGATIAPTQQLWITETGYRVDTGNYTQTQQAGWIARYLLAGPHNGVERTYIYSIQDSAGESPALWGIFDINGTARTAASDLTNLLAILSDPTPVANPAWLDLQAVSTASLQWYVFQDGSSNWWVLLWNTADPGGTDTGWSTTLTLGQTVIAASVYRPRTGTSATSIYSGAGTNTVTVTAHLDPIIVKLVP